MFVDKVKKVTFTCSSCNTSIKFDILPGDDETRTLLNTITHLKCPKCETSLAGWASETLKTIYDYNNAVVKISALAECMDFELD